MLEDQLNHQNPNPKNIPYGFISDGKGNTTLMAQSHFTPWFYHLALPLCFECVHLVVGCPDSCKIGGVEGEVIELHDPSNPSIFSEAHSAQRTMRIAGKMAAQATKETH